MLVRDIMEKKVITIHDDATLSYAAEIFNTSKSSDLIVIDDERNFKGILSESDLLRTLSPNCSDIENCGGSLIDAEKLFIESAQHLSHQPIKPLVINNPLTLHPDDSLMKATAIMLDEQIGSLAVVEFDKFIGTVSRSDIIWILVHVA